mmetsp:Transcript_25677/g.55934  ORF Transcript_25677/g.55934 Transcript_25677/m.55934 type:complete len:82 (+) Transcript_25677:203-448(+)
MSYMGIPPAVGQGCHGTCTQEHGHTAMLQTVHHSQKYIDRHTYAADKTTPKFNYVAALRHLPLLQPSYYMQAAGNKFTQHL